MDENKNTENAQEQPVNIADVRRLLPLSSELIAEAKEMLELSYIVKGVEGVPNHMPKQKKLVAWAKKMAELVSGNNA